MIKILLSLLFLFPSMANATITLISNTCTGGSISGGTTTAINTTGASLIVVTTPDNYGVGTISDSQSNTWSSVYQSNTNAPYTDMWYVAGPSTSSSHTFTTTGVYAAICVAAFSGTLTSTATALDQQNNNSNTSGTFLTTGSVTPTQNNELIVTSVSINSSGNYPNSINSSFTLLSPTLAQVDGSYFGSGMAYLIQTTSGAVNPTWTANGFAYSMSATIETFKAASPTSINNGFTRFLT